LSALVVLLTIDVRMDKKFSSRAQKLAPRR
jgi:hypothetical protein